VGLIIGGLIAVVVATSYLVRIRSYKYFGADSVGFWVVSVAFGSVFGRLLESVLAGEELPAFFIQTVLLSVWAIHIVIFIKSVVNKKVRG